MARKSSGSKKTDVIMERRVARASARKVTRSAKSRKGIKINRKVAIAAVAATAAVAGAVAYNRYRKKAGEKKAKAVRDYGKD